MANLSCETVATLLISLIPRNHSIISDEVANLGPYCTAELFEDFGRSGKPKRPRISSRVRFPNPSSEPTMPLDDVATAGAFQSHRLGASRSAGPANQSLLMPP